MAHNLNVAAQTHFWCLLRQIRTITCLLGNTFNEPSSVCLVFLLSGIATCINPTTCQEWGSCFPFLLGTSACLQSNLCAPYRRTALIPLPPGRAAIPRALCVCCETVLVSRGACWARAADGGLCTQDTGCVSPAPAWKRKGLLAFLLAWSMTAVVRAGSQRIRRCQGKFGLYLERLSPAWQRQPWLHGAQVWMLPAFCSAVSAGTACPGTPCSERGHGGETQMTNNIG